MKKEILDIKKKQISEILSKYPEARNDDIKLYCLIGKEFYGIPDLYEHMKKIGHFETVRRTRQLMQASGQYEALPAVKEARAMKQEEFRNTIREQKKLF